MTVTPHTQGLALMVICLLAFSATAQQKESFDGFVSGIRPNAIKGKVFCQRNEAKFDLDPGLKLEEGDVIRTGPDSYAELLLQPGNYLRLGGDSELQIFSDPYDKMRLKLNQGSISLEILAREGEDSSYFAESVDQVYELIRIITPSAEVFITRPGIFRINTSSPERTELIVRDGEAVINGRRVKQKRSAIASREDVTINEGNQRPEDSFDSWCHARADELVQANRLLKKESPWANKKEDEEPSVDVPPDLTQSSKNRYVVSARPGAVNFVETGVEFNHQSKDWEPLSEKSKLEAGDKVRTCSHSYAELTMLADINLRLDGESEVVLEQLSNESVSVKLLRGSAILDVARFDSKEAPNIVVAGTSTSFTIADKGNYRIDTSSNGDEITIREGKVNFQGRYVGSCRKIAGGTVSECQKKKSDNFDFWSEHQGEGEFFNGRDVVVMVSHLAGVRRVRFRNRGFWFQHPGKISYTFVPYSSPYFRSPYGGHYSTVLTPRSMPIIRIDRGDGPFGRFPTPDIKRPPAPRP